MLPVAGDKPMIGSSLYVQLSGVEGLGHAKLVSGDGGIPSGQQLVDR